MAPQRNKSGLHPARYELLSQDEHAQVRAAMVAYNKSHPGDPYFEIIDFYHNVYRLPKNTQALKLAAVLGIAGALAVSAGSILWGNLFFASANPPLIAQFWSNGGKAQVCQFAIYEGLAILGIVLHLGGIT